MMRRWALSLSPSAAACTRLQTLALERLTSSRDRSEHSWHRRVFCNVWQLPSWELTSGTNSVCVRNSRKTLSSRKNYGSVTTERGPRCTSAKLRKCRHRDVLKLSVEDEAPPPKDLDRRARFLQPYYEALQTNEEIELCEECE